MKTNTELSFVFPFTLGRLYDLCLSYHPTVFLWYFVVIVCLPSLLVSGFMGRLDDLSREKGPLSYHPISLLFFSSVCLSSLHVLGFMGRLDDLSGGAYIDILS